MFLLNPIWVLRIRATHAFPGPPNAREGEERPVVGYREPHRRLARSVSAYSLKRVTGRRQSAFVDDEEVGVVQTANQMRKQCP